MAEEQQTQNHESKTEKGNTDGFFINLFRWNMDEKELKYQVDNYNTLGFFRSAKGVVIALMIVSAIITLIFMPNDWVDIIVILVLTLFIYKGSRVALIIAMIYWTFSKVLQIVGAFSSVENSNTAIVWSAIIFWTIWMGAFWQAYQVERERKKITDSFIKTGDYIYCQHCGAKIPQDSKFCPKCGDKTKYI